MLAEAEQAIRKQAQLLQEVDPTVMQSFAKELTLRKGVERVITQQLKATPKNYVPWLVTEGLYATQADHRDLVRLTDPLGETERLMACRLSRALDNPAIKGPRRFMDFGGGMGLSAIRLAHHFADAITEGQLEMVVTNLEFKPNPEPDQQGHTGVTQAAKVEARSYIGLTYTPEELQYSHTPDLILATLGALVSGRGMLITHTKNMFSTKTGPLDIDGRKVTLTDPDHTAQRELGLKVGINLLTDQYGLQSQVGYEDYRVFAAAR